MLGKILAFIQLNCYNHYHNHVIWSWSMTVIILDILGLSVYWVTNYSVLIIVLGYPLCKFNSFIAYYLSNMILIFVAIMNQAW